MRSPRGPFCPGRLLLPRNSHFFLFKSRRGHQIVVISEEEGRQHRIAFNSLYLFSSKSINYKANGEALYDSRVERLISSSCLFRELPVSDLFPVDARKHPGGVASMTRDRGYPDWLVLSARLLLQPTCGQVTIGQNIYVLSCSLVAM